MGFGCASLMGACVRAHSLLPIRTIASHVYREASTSSHQEHPVDRTMCICVCLCKQQRIRCASSLLLAVSCINYWCRVYRFIGQLCTIIMPGNHASIRIVNIYGNIFHLIFSSLLLCVYFYVLLFWLLLLLLVVLYMASQHNHSTTFYCTHLTIARIARVLGHDRHERTNFFLLPTSLIHWK